MAAVVHLYVETDIHGPSRRDGRYIYVLQYISPSGKTAELVKGREIADTTENTLVLEALTAGVSELNKQCELHIHTNNQHFIHTYTNRWHRKWQKNGWIKSNGTIPANAELWKKVCDTFINHYVSVDPDEHEFSKWMQSELKNPDFKDKYIKR